MEPEEEQSVKADWRPWPLLTLNDHFQDGAGEQILSELLNELKSAGYGGVFIHPRPGLITEYLGSRWFEIIRHIISKCDTLGLYPALYDENSYPSGFAGGHVPANAPETISRYTLPIFGKGLTQLPTDFLCLNLFEDNIPGQKLSCDQIGEHTRWVAFVLRAMEPLPWHAGFPYVSLVDKETAQVFLEKTHNRYRKEISTDDWGKLRAVFTDEPHLTSESHGAWGTGLHLSQYVVEQFNKRRGYDLCKNLPHLYWNLPDCESIRFDYYETLHELWLENWAKPIHNWCEKHTLALTGHYLEHDWPCPYATPGHMHLLKYMTWPGTDLLEAFLLEGHNGGDSQNLIACESGRETHPLYYLRQVLSIANQFTKERVICECWGAGGNDSTPADWLRIGRFLVVNGVNLLVPHYSPVTIRGTRKTDHPQFFSRQHPAFKHFKAMNDELGRLCMYSAKGKMENRLLLLDPLTTGYCHAAKSDCLDLERSYDDWLRPDFITKAQESFHDLRTSTAKFVQDLSEHCVDFDIADEYILQEDATFNLQKLIIGAQKYECVVLPPKIENLRSSTFDIIKQYLVNGGIVLGIRRERNFIDGRVYDWSSELDSLGNMLWAKDSDDLLLLCLKHVKPRVSSSSKFPQGWAHMRRVSDGCTTYIFCNSGKESWTGCLFLNETGHRILINAKTGQKHQINNSSIIQIDSTEAVVIEICESFSSKLEPSNSIVSKKSHGNLIFENSAPCSENVWILDTCHTEFDGIKYGHQHVYSANKLYWKTSGMTTNGWYLSVQYRNSVLDRAARLKSCVKSRFSYEFELPAEFDYSKMEVAIETPNLWDIEINGDSFKFNDSITWRDPHLMRKKIGRWLKPGINTIDLKCSNFDGIKEIDQIYLFGDFALEPSYSGFKLTNANSLSLGSWKEQGMPFYDEDCTYSFQVPCEWNEVTLEISRDQWCGSCVRIQSERDDRISYGPDICEKIVLGNSRNVRITVTGLPINLFGPFHVADVRPKRAWSLQWIGPDVPESPVAGSSYRLQNFGLFSAPRFFDYT